jgi:predicted metal-dependent hydrolase
LLRMLEETPAEEAGKVLDLTILLLFQQVKNIVAFGSSLYPDILKLLMAERKICDDIANALTKLSECVESAVDTALVNTVKECGLSRDISKHKIT